MDELKSDLTDGTKYTKGVGQCKQRMHSAMDSQPRRQRILALVMGRNAVDLIKAERAGPLQPLVFTHTGVQSFSLESTSPGFSIFLAFSCMSLDAAGYIRPLPPPVSLCCGQLVPDSWAPLKQSLTDVDLPFSPRGTNVYRVDVLMGSQEEMASCILKIGRKEHIEREVSSSPH